MEASDIKHIILAIVVGGFIIRLAILSKRKSKFGINLSAVYCPICKTKQPRIRIPLNERQRMYGGSTCSGCKTEIDKYGDVVK